MYQYHSPSFIREKPSSVSTLFARPMMSTASSSAGSSTSGVAQRSSTWQDRLQGPQTPLPLRVQSHGSTRAPAQSIWLSEPSISTPSSFSPNELFLKDWMKDSLLTSPSSPLLPASPLVPGVQSLLRPSRQAHRLVLPHHRLRAHDPGSLLV